MNALSNLSKISSLDSKVIKFPKRRHIISGRMNSKTGEQPDENWGYLDGKQFFGSIMDVPQSYKWLPTKNCVDSYVAEDKAPQKGIFKPTEATNLRRKIDQNRFGSLSKSNTLKNALEMIDSPSTKRIKKALQRIGVNYTLKPISKDSSSGNFTSTEDSKIARNCEFSSATQNLKLDFSHLRSTSDWSRQRIMNKELSKSTKIAKKYALLKPVIVGSSTKTPIIKWKKVMSKHIRWGE